MELISQHIPKTAGTAFSKALQAWFPRGVEFDYERQYSIETTLTLGLTARLRAAVRRRRRLSSVTPTVLHGHLDLRKVLKDWPNAALVTWLRDPVARVISQYEYWSQVGETIHPVARRMRSEGWTLLDFAMYPDNRNLQARYLSPLHLNDFVFVGVSEHYAASVEVLAREIGMPNHQEELAVVNRTPSSAESFAGMPANHKQWIREMNAMDALLHAEATRIVERSIR